MDEEKTSSWSWKVSQTELSKQIQGYNTLKMTETYRGIAVLVVSALLLLSLVLGYFGITSLEDVLFSLVLYVPVLFFVYKGHKWAIITLFILWTIDKVATLIYSVDAGGSPIGSVIWFLIVAPIIYKAYVVERERSEENPMKYTDVTVAVHNKNFCSECGERQSSEAVFCKSCGYKVSE